MKAMLIVLGLAAIAGAQPSGWTPEFSMQFKNIGSVAPSPDGSKVVWTQIEAVMDAEHSEMREQIFLANADGSHRLQLTRGEKSSTNPSFSPDGRMVYFESARTGRNQIYRIYVAGGEAEQITDFKGDIGAYQLSPDGKTVAFSGYEPPPDLEKNRKEKRDFRVVDSNPANHSIYLIPADADNEGKRAFRKLTDGKRDVNTLEWSPDSRAIAFTHAVTPDADDWTTTELSELDVASGAIKSIAATHTISPNVFYSHDGRYLAYTKSLSDPPRWAFDGGIVLLNRSTGEARALPATYDEQPELLGFAGDRVLFTEARHTRGAIYEMPVDGPPRTLFEPSKGMFGGNGVHLNATGTMLGLPMESCDDPPEAYVMAVSSKTPLRVSRANVDMPKLPVGKTEVIHWKAKDGLDVEGLITYPVNYEPGKKYPLIVVIHGGPTGVFQESFTGRISLYPIAVFAARGYAVLRANPRGSSGYGKAFRFANYNDWGGKDYEDIQSGVDRVIELGVADPDRMAVMGWSYGGFMTSWTITQTHRFKAAVVGAGVTDLWSFTGTSDIMGFLPDYFGGEPWKQFDNYRKHSPITYVKNVTTPTLILHGEADIRVPTSQGYELYHSLRREGVIAKMVVYPRQPHSPGEPKFILDIMNRHLDWVDKYVR
ncbi:MAG TPA: S9 family peptidase [Bryobacteraceae bacterium]|nr:S9 family peptidase [Bryobacteraceae bacterium]